MAEAYIGQIQAFGFTFAPRNWALCDGQLLAVSQNEALFSLIGTTYGGDGRTTFGLPDLRGRLSLHYGDGPGLSSRRIGQKSGQETQTLILNELASHHHPVAPGAASLDASQTSPQGNYPALTAASSYAGGTNVAMGNTNSGNTGGGGAHNNMEPYLTISWCICLFGIFPSRS